MIDYLFLMTSHGGPKGSNTNKYSKTQINIRKHKSIFENTNQFSKTQINFRKHANENSKHMPKEW